MSSNTQLTSANGYDTQRMIFNDPVKGTIPNSNPPIAYQRINIQTLNEDGTVGDLIIPTSELFSFGVSENKDPNTQKVNGHVLPLCLWSRDGATPDEKTWHQTFDAVVERCKEHLIEFREELDKDDLIMSDLRKFNPLYWKREKNDKGKTVIVEGRGPTLYVKLIASKKQGTIKSMFFDENDVELAPLDLLGKYCFARAAVKIESIFLGSKISLQIKLYEVTVRLMASSMPRLMRPEGKSRLMNAKTNPMTEVKSNSSDEENSDTGSIHDDTDIEDEPVSLKAKNPIKKKRVVRKVRRVKKASA